MAYPLPVTEQGLQPPAQRPLLAVGILRDAAGSSRNYTSGSAAGSLLRYPGLDSYAWWTDPDLAAPVRVHLSESLTGVFADAQIEVTHLPVDAATVEVGDLRSIDTDVRPGEAWYTWRVASRSDQAGLVSLTGETLLGRLARIRPRESLILVAGQDGVPDPLDLRECLRRFLQYYGVPFVDDIPPFFLRAGDEIVVPTPPAFVIQPDQESPESILDWLERFFAPFRGYGFRADGDDRLTVTPPAWAETLGLNLVLYRQVPDPTVRRASSRQQASVPWSGSQGPVVEWVASVDGVPYSGSLPEPLVHGGPLGQFQIGPVTVRIQWRSSDGRVQASIWPPPPADLTLGSLYTITITLRSAEDDDQALQLLPAALGPDATITLDAERVVNQAAVRVQALDWQTDQQLMQAGALVLRSPVQTAAGLFGNNFPYGPMAEELETPNDFLEIANEISQAGTWFWPVDDDVVMQPGGTVTVAYEVEEWAEMWGHNNVFLPQPAEQVNTHSGTVELPANGSEVLLFSLQFPRRTWATSIGGYQAQGRVYGRWRAGENPGVEIRVGNSRFAEYGYLPEFLGVFGQNVYFLWGAVIKLNGTGTTFTTGATTVHRFGYAQNDDGTWEGGANVPALSESQAVYPSRSLEVTLPYPLSEAEALAVARGIVEENLHPRAVHELTVAPHPDLGWPVTPQHLGRVIEVPSLNLHARHTSITYDEMHTPAGSHSTVLIELEETGRIPGSITSSSTYGAAHYGRSAYQEED